MPISMSSFLGYMLSDYEDETFLPSFSGIATSKCNNCKTDYDELIETGLLGCENCYNVGKYLNLCACAALCCASVFYYSYFETKCPKVRGGPPRCRSPPALHFVSPQPEQNEMEDKL